MSKTAINICDNYPTPPLYRFFSSDQWADDFIGGQIRLGWLKKYLKLEGDIRQDTTEGTAQYPYNDPDQLTITIDRNTGKEISRIRGHGIAHISSSTLNQFYILCTSRLNKNNTIIQLRERFNDPQNKKLPRYAEIYNIELFTKKIAEALDNSKYTEFIIMKPRWFEAEYSKGKKRSQKEPDFYLDVYQKPSEFKIEQEWRLAILIRDKTSIGLLPKKKQNIMFVKGKARKKRITEYYHIPLENQNINPELYKMQEELIPLWIEDIISEHPGGFHDCVRLLD